MRQKSEVENLHDYQSFPCIVWWETKKRTKEKIFVQIILEGKKSFQNIYPLCKPNTEVYQSFSVGRWCSVLFQNCFLPSMLSVQKGLFLSAIGNKIIQNGENLDSHRRKKKFFELKIIIKSFHEFYTRGSKFFHKWFQ